MKNKKAILMMWIFALLPAAMVLAVWSRLPEQVPIHWGLNSQVDGWGSPATLLALTATGPVLALLFQLLSRLDPKRRNYERFQDWYDLFASLVPLIIVVVTGLTLSETFRPGTIQVGRAVSLLVAVLFLILGNMMGKVKPNWFMGFRTPWALSDPDVWNKTQRMGGRVFFLAGLVTLPLSFFAPEWLLFAALLGILLVGIVATYVMSWKWYKDKKQDSSIEE